HTRTRLLSDAESEVERCACVRRAVDPDSTIMPDDDPLHGREADASTGKIRVTVQAIEWCEQLCCALHVEADAAVANEECWAVGVVSCPELDTSPLARGRELPCVCWKVLQH